MPRRTADPTIRPRILDAADGLLARHGFRRMTVDAIAAAAGIGKGTVYLHFASKDEVALSCLDRMSERLATSLKSLAVEPGPTLPRLREMLKLRVLHRARYAAPHARSIDQILAALRAPMLERRAKHFEHEAALLAGVLREGARTGELRITDARRTARTLVTATNALLPYSLSVRELGRRAELARRAGDLADLLLAGLVTRRFDSSLKPRSPRRIP